jgi:hypothetical protein
MCALRKKTPQCPGRADRGLPGAPAANSDDLDRDGHCGIAPGHRQRHRQETRTPIGLTIIGGTIVSTVFTLFVVPCVYLLLTRFEKHKEIELSIEVSAHASRETAPAVLAEADSAVKEVPRRRRRNSI